MSGRLHHMWPDVNPAVRALRILGIVVAGVIIAAVFALAFGWLVMLLWNWLMPTIFHLGVIGYWQAFGIVILAKLIFGGMGSGRHWGPKHGPGRGGPHGRDKDDWRYYREFWDKEGKGAFERYVQDRKAAEGAGKEPGTPGA
jgi:hypothetical protein